MSWTALTPSTSTPTTPPHTSPSSTDAGEQGHAFVFTCGRGNDIVTHAIDAYSELLIGADVDELIGDLGSASKRLIHDSQLRWLGPEKGVTQMACGALINALWDIRARRENKPLWLLLSEMSPEELVDVVDFTHIRNALTPADALDILRRAQDGKAERIAALKADGFPAYTTSPGWLGYSDEKLVRLSKQAVADGFSMIKLKVGGSVEDDRRRLPLAREAVGSARSPSTPISGGKSPKPSSGSTSSPSSSRTGSRSPPAPTTSSATPRSAAASHPIRVATGEAVANRIVFKQLLQAQAIDVLQLDATRVGGVNENVANLLLAAQFGVPVCPHAGGVGLCELVQHFSFFDYAAVPHPGRTDDRVRRPPARALRRTGPHRRGALRRPAAPRHRIRDRPGIEGPLVVPRRRRLARGRRPRRRHRCGDLSGRGRMSAIPQQSHQQRSH